MMASPEPTKVPQQQDIPVEPLEPAVISPTSATEQDNNSNCEAKDDDNSNQDQDAESIG